MTKDQLHYHATTMMGLSFDAEKNEYFSTWGQYAAPELRGTRRVVSVEQIEKSAGIMDKQFARFGTE